jgi:hypothetical protein
LYSSLEAEVLFFSGVEELRKMRMIIEERSLREHKFSYLLIALAKFEEIEIRDEHYT